MKMSHMKAAAVAVLCCSGLFLNSCMYEVPVYGGVSYSNGYGSVSAWTAASYDANGFPIYGYYYGRPVYGYTAEGVAIFTFAALTAACFVPYWAPAPWYHGHWHYPHHIHRVNVPHHCPHDHFPSHRPAGGMNAPIHKNPQSVLRPQHNSRAPQASHMDFRDHGADKRHNSPQPGVGRLEHQRRQGSNLPVFNPQQPKGDRGHNARPADRNAAGAPQMNMPHANRADRAPQFNVPQKHHRSDRGAQMNIPAHSAPAMPQISRPSAPSAPSAPAHGGHNFGGHNFGGHGGGNHGGHRH